MAMAHADTFTHIASDSTAPLVVLVAHSDNDDISGNWTPDKELMYSKDGGHGMIFQDLKGTYHLVLHSPNTFGKEHPVFIPLKYEQGRFIEIEE